MDYDNKNISVVVLAGGPSEERQVSQASGQAIADALASAGFTVSIADITPDDLSALDNQADVFFPALHGEFGEDGQLQEIMEQRDLIFCGSPSHACALAMDKYNAKLKMLELNIPTPRFDIAASEDDIATAKACWSIPVVVKPVKQGSSLGITIVHNAEQLEETIRKTLDEYGPVMVEQFIEGRELTVGILADKALPILEIRTEREFYDYDAKYEDSSTEYIFVTDLHETLYKHIQELSLLAARGLGLRDFCRVDWRLSKQNQPWFLEANAIPGFTNHSLLPKAAEKAGYPMPDMCKMIVELAMERSKTSVGH